MTDNPPMQKALRRIKIGLLSTLAALIILAAALLGLSRMLLPMAGDYRAEIEQQLSRMLEQPIKIGAVGATWQGLNPSLQLKDVHILDMNGKHTLLAITEAQYALNLPYYVRYRQFGRGKLLVNGTVLPLLRRSSGEIVIEGFDDTKGEFTDWLTQQKQLTLENSEIIWRDELAAPARQGKPLHFQDVALLLKNRGQRHQLNGSLNLSGGAGQQLTVALDFTGDLLDHTQWIGGFYLQGTGVRFVQWLAAPSLVGITAQDGVADFKLWGELRQTQLQRLEGDVEVRSLQLNGAGQTPVAINRVSGELKWQRQSTGWSLAAPRLVVGRDNHFSAPSQINIVATAQSQQPPSIDVQVSALRLEDATTLLLASNLPEPGQRDALIALQPHGELQTLHMIWQATAPGQLAQNKFSLQTRLTGVSASAWKEWPAARGIDGALSANDRGGTFNINSRQAQLEFAHMFPAPLLIDTWTGTLSWQRDAQQAWHIEAKDMRLTNADISTRLNGTLDVPAGAGSSVIDLGAAFENGKIASTPRYLPANLLPPDALTWLRASLLGGHVNAGTAQIRGPLSEFPFTDGKQGNFEVRFDVSNVLLEYDAAWPRISGINADVVFHGRGLEIQAHGGKIFAADIQQATAVIPDMTLAEPVLMVQGKARGSSADALRFVKESPIKEKIGNYSEGASATGKSQVELNLLIPLSSAPARVKGAVKLSDTTLRVGDKQKNRAVEIGQINGVLNFTEASLNGKDIGATLFDQKAKVNVFTETAGADGSRSGGAVVVEARSRMSIADLSKQAQKLAPDLRKDLFGYFSGTADWSAALRLSNERTATVGPELIISSDLQGVRAELPEPLAKQADQNVPLAINIALSDQLSRRYSVSYGDRLSGIFELQQVKTATASPSSWELKRGELRLGKGTAVLPDKGLRLAGELPRLSLSAWNDFLTGTGTATNTQANNKATPPSLIQKLEAIDVRIGVLEAFDQEFNDSQIKAAKTPQAWSVTLNSTQVAGNLHLPQGPNPVWEMNFERLHLAKSAKPDAPQDSSKEQGLDPRRLPALRLTSNSFRYGELDLGSLNVEASKRPAGLHVDKLQLASPALQVTGQGDWEAEGNIKRVSRFNLLITSDELGKALTNLGYTSNNIVGGKSNLDLTAHWQGSPANFALERLNGVLLMKIEKGRFLDIEPGAGRIFGLLSVQTLPRRLSLDFSDIFEKGFAFDLITGEFTLDNGNAHTKNLIMTGPSAIVAINGRTGLAAKDYDQVVTVKPQIGASLPLAGALAAGLGIGAAILLAQKLLQPQIDDIAGYQSTIKGSWDEPKVEPISVQTSKGAG